MRISHIAWNFGGLALPLGIAVVTVPHLIASLGHERFGLLALAWGLIGYASAMDLGMGRALTQLVARLRGEQALETVPAVLATANRISLLTGIAGAFLLLAAAYGGVASWLRTEQVTVTEIQYSIILLAVALPAQAMSATYRGVNEALLNFKGISLLRAVLGVLNFAGPYAVSLFTSELHWLVATLVVSRVTALLVFRWLAHRCLHAGGLPREQAAYSPSIARSLFSFGGWVTVSSVVSPMLVQADRFVIASTISAAAVSIYVVPYEVVVQSLILVGAVSSVMFPGLSALIAEKPDGWQAYFRTWTWRVAILMAVVCSSIAAILPMLLPLWITDGLHRDSVRVGQILCLGVFANAIGSMFYSLLHAKGKADVTAKLHLVELPVFLVALVFLAQRFGVVGCAWAWVGRMVVDCLLLAWKSSSLNRRIVRAPVHIA